LDTAAPWSLISSIDPFTGDGLIDVLPKGVSKASAIEWWASQQGLSQDEIVFAGDSGNDAAALSAGYLVVTVGNARESVVNETCQAHIASGWTDRHHHSERPATSGVLDGLTQFLRRDSV